MPPRGKVHLVRSARANSIAACGVVRPVRRTRYPSQVTCERCRRTVQMADAEIIERRRTAQ